MPKGPQGQKRPADVIGAAVMVARIATGEIAETPAKSRRAAAVERLANAATAPLSKKKLKAHLVKEGFPPKRLGNYFYTVLRRLNDHERIVVYDNGTVWKASAR